jgi:hypothetical protein
LDDDRLGDRPLLSGSKPATDIPGTRDFARAGTTAGRSFRDAGHDDGDGDEPVHGDPGLDADALHASHVEHQLTLRDAIKAYPMAIFWSLAVSMCVIMEGFDSILVPNFYAFPTFQRKCTFNF